MRWPSRRHYQAPFFDAGRDARWAWGTKTFVMGIVNATDDSFSDDGVADCPEAAAALAVRFERAGADIVDVGGASSRPGAAPTPLDVELRRAVGAVEAVREAVSLPVSVDTTHAEVARAALDAGATVVNDITGLRSDAAMARVVAEAGAGVVAMHNQRGRRHTDTMRDVIAGLRASLEICERHGIGADRVIVDPGFGFGFGPAQNLEMLRRLGELCELGLPILIGTSRKSTIGAVTGADVGDRLCGTAASVALAVAAGVDVVRVHDVPEMLGATQFADAVVRANAPTRADPAAPDDLVTPGPIQHGHE